MQEDSPQRSDLNSKENTRNQKKSVTKINGNSGNEVHKGSSASVNHINEAGNGISNQIPRVSGGMAHNAIEHMVVVMVALQL